MILSSRGVSVFNMDAIFSFRLRLMAASDGDSTFLSSMKSPRWASSSSPIGVSKDSGCCAIFLVRRTASTGRSIRRPTSSEVGFRLAAQDHRERALQAGRANLAVLGDFSELRAAGTQLLARFGGGIAASRDGATFQPRSFALQGFEALDAVVHDVNQALLLAFLEIDGADEPRQRNACARHPPAGRQIPTPIGLCGVLQPCCLPEPHRVELLDLVDDPERAASPVLKDTRREGFFVDSHDLLNPPGAVAQPSAGGQ